MDPRHLVQLATILDKGTLTEASRHLHLTQPTLTHNMQTLEMQAGGLLFERSRYGVRSTPLGEMLAREGRAIARRTKDALEITARHRSGVRNQIHIGAGALVSAAVLAGMVQALLAHLPDLALTVQSDRPHLLVEQLTDGRYDFLVAPTWQDRPPPGIERQLLFRDALGIFCGTGHVLAGRQGLQPQDLEGARWIGLGSGSPFDQDVRDLLQTAGLQPPRVDVIFLGEPVVLMDTMGHGAHLAVLPRLLLGRLAARFGLAELPLPWLPAIPRSMYLWSRAATLEDPAMQQVARLLVDEARRLQPRDAGA